MDPAEIEEKLKDENCTKCICNGACGEVSRTQLAYGIEGRAEEGLPVEAQQDGQTFPISERTSTLSRYLAEVDGPLLVFPTHRA